MVCFKGLFLKRGEKKRFELEDVHCSRRGCRRELNCSRTLLRGLQSPSFFGAGIDRWA